MRYVPQRVFGLIVLRLALAAVVAACANPVQMQSAMLVPVFEGRIPDVVLAASVNGSSTAGYARTLEAGTRWRTIGTIEQGRVLKPLDSVLTAEGTHVREARIVIRGGKWTGFWLPVERVFSPLRQPVPIEFRRSSS